MRAVINTRPGSVEVLEVQDRPMPEPGVGQVRVRVHASALNRADLLQRMGNYPPPPGVSAEIPGLEYAGTVDAAGPGVSLWQPGDRVMGITGGAAHAEYLCVQEREAIAMPAALSHEEAAAIPEAFLTAYDALHRQLDIRLGEHVLIHAVGSGVGTAALQLVQAAGAFAIGTSRSANKLARAREMELHHAIDGSSDAWPVAVEAVVGVNGTQAIIDLVGGPYLAGNLRVLSLRGRLIFVGLTAGRTAQLDMGTVLSKRLRINGTVLRSRPLEEKIALAREFSDRITPLFGSARLRPVVDRVFAFDDIRAAHELMESNATFGKIVLRWN